MITAIFSIYVGGYVTLNVLLLSCGCMCSVSLPLVPWAGLRSVNVAFPGHTYMLFGDHGPKNYYYNGGHKTHQSISGGQWNLCSLVCPNWSLNGMCILQHVKKV